MERNSVGKIVVLPKSINYPSLCIATEWNNTDMHSSHLSRHKIDIRSVVSTIRLQHEFFYVVKEFFLNFIFINNDERLQFFFSINTKDFSRGFIPSVRCVHFQLNNENCIKLKNSVSFQLTHTFLSLCLSNQFHCK